MYTGLLMFPWVLLFGISGMLFNHPNVGEKTEGARLGPQALEELTGFLPWDPESAANALVEELNAVGGNGSYTLDPSYAPGFHGIVLFRADAPEARNLLILDVEQGVGLLSTRYARPKAEPPPFALQDLQLNGFSIDRIEDQVDGLLEAQGVATEGPLKAHPAIGPTLRLRVLDAQGEAWNVTYNVRRGLVGGRRTAEPSNIGLNQLLGMLHMTHHYTMSLSAPWFWALFEDLLGLTMALWALTGLAMWWQMKPTRTLGLLAVLAALVIAYLITSGTAGHLMFGQVEYKLSP